MWPGSGTAGSGAATRCRFSGRPSSSTAVTGPDARGRELPRSQFHGRLGRDGFALQFASAELQVDRDVVLESVWQWGWALQSAAAEFQVPTLCWRFCDRRAKL